jgi:hypothetical protein
MIDDKKLEERLVALEAAKSWSPRVVSRLEMLLRSGADEALYRINPIQFAAEKSIAEAEAIDLSSMPARLGYSIWTGCSFVRCAPTLSRASEAWANCTPISTATSVKPITTPRSTITSR